MVLSIQSNQAFKAPPLLLNNKTQQLLAYYLTTAQQTIDDRYVVSNTTDVAEKQLPVAFVSNQQGKMGCGTNALVIIYNALGIPVLHKEVDKKIRRFGSFLSPTLMMRDARKRGLHSRMLNKSNFNEIKEEIDKKNYLAVLFRRKIVGHYEVVTGYRVDKEGNQFISLTDETSKTVKEIPFEEFDKQWNNFKILGVQMPYRRFMISFSKDKDIMTRWARLPITNFFVTMANRLINGAAKLIGAE